MLYRWGGRGLLGSIKCLRGRGVVRWSSGSVICKGPSEADWSVVGDARWRWPEGTASGSRPQRKAIVRGMESSFVKSVTFDCDNALSLAAFWAAALGSDVDEDSTPEKAYVEAPGWGGPNLWFAKVPEGKTAKNRMHFDLRAPGSIAKEVERLAGLGATIVHRNEDLVVMQDPEGNEFCVE
jgi:hypothetical protein